MESRRQALIFFVGEHQYAMDILHLREVGRMPQVEPEPGAPKGVVGVARMHGAPVRVHALAPLLGESVGAEAPAPGADAARPWLLVSREATGERHWMVDGVQDIVEYDLDEIRHQGREADDGPRSVGILEVDGRLTYLLTPDLLSLREGAR